MEDHMLYFSVTMFISRKYVSLKARSPLSKKPVLMADVELEDVSGSFQLFVTYDFR